MSAGLLFDNFDLLAEASNGVDELRNLVLRMALGGKLSTQLPNDGSSLELVQRLNLARSRYWQEKGKHEIEQFTPLSSEDIPFDIPTRWSWIRVGEAADLINGKAFKPSEWSKAGTPIVRIQNLNNPQAPFNYSDHAVEERYYVSDSDLLIGWSGTPGTSFGAFIWTRGNAVLNQHIFKAALYADVYFKPFLRLAINGRLEEMIAKAHGGVGLQHITKGKFESLAIPLPPVVEQRRIVAKVDQLMALCDELEEKQKKQNEARISLNTSALEHLLAAKDPKEFDKHWQRIRTNFDLLYDKPETVGKLRQAILQLGVQGKLVPQDPDDEPATAPLEKIKVEKERLIREKHIKKSEPLPPIADDELPYEVPKGWVWARFHEVATIASNLVHPQKFQKLPHVAPDNIEKGTGRLLSYRTVEEDEVRSGNHRFFSGQIIYSKIRPNLSKAALVDFDGLCSADMYPIISHIDSGYLLKYILSSPFLKQSVKSDTRVAMPKINQTELNAILVPVPPLREQKAIDSKVSELMSHCDELETNLTHAEKASDELVEAVVKKVLGRRKADTR